MKCKKKRYSCFWSLSLLSTLALAGCATVSNDVSLKKMRPKDRVYSGQIEVTLNGEKATQCELYLNLDIAPSIKLAEDEILVYKTDREHLKFKRIACYQKLGDRLGAWHHQKLNLKALERPEDRSSLVYFGKIRIDWVVDKDMAKQAAMKIVDVTSNVKVGQVKDSGELAIEIVSDQSPILEFLDRNVPEFKTKNLVLVENLAAKETE